MTTLEKYPNSVKVVINVKHVSRCTHHRTYKTTRAYIEGTVNTELSTAPTKLLNLFKSGKIEFIKAKKAVNSYPTITGTPEDKINKIAKALFLGLHESTKTTQLTLIYSDDKLVGISGNLAPK
jgi:hypothetical protein